MGKKLAALSDAPGLVGEGGSDEDDYIGKGHRDRPAVNDRAPSVDNAEEMQEADNDKNRSRGTHECVVVHKRRMLLVMIL